MNLGRRDFLGALTTALVAAAVDPERLLWEPGKRVHFDLWTPPRFYAVTESGWWDGDKWHIERFVPLDDIQHADVVQTLTADGTRIGYTVNVKLPQRYRGIIRGAQ